MFIKMASLYSQSDIFFLEPKAKIYAQFYEHRVYTICTLFRLFCEYYARIEVAIFLV